jgi:uncharacterized sodium:solute symporter family permease YidK
MSADLHWADYLSLAGYFLAVVAFGIWTIIPKSNRDNVGGYFLASKSMHFIPLGASLFASNIGSGHLIGIFEFVLCAQIYSTRNFFFLLSGLSGGAAISGHGVTGFEGSAPFILALLGWVFLPVYIRYVCLVFSININ